MKKGVSLEDLESAEDFFRFFGLDFDRSAVMVHRFLILAAFGEKKKELDLRYPELSGEERFFKYKEALQLSYHEATGGPRPMKKPSCSGCSGCAASSFEGFRAMDLREKDGGL